MSESIGELLGTAAQRLSDRVFDEMWADPFWRARFGVVISPIKKWPCCFTP